jgi:hypothetical protein
MMLAATNNTLRDWITFLVCFVAYSAIGCVVATSSFVTWRRRDQNISHRPNPLGPVGRSVLTGAGWPIGMWFWFGIARITAIEAIEK